MTSTPNEPGHTDITTTSPTCLQAGKTYTYDHATGTLTETRPADPRGPIDAFSDFVKAAALRDYAKRQRDIAEKFFRHLYYLLNAGQVEKESPGDGMGYSGWPAEDLAELLRALHLDKIEKPPAATELKDALSWVCGVTARGTFLAGDPAEVEPAWERELRWADRTENAKQLRAENEALRARLRELRELLHCPLENGPQ